MTLIACLHPRQSRTLLADVLITSKTASDEEVDLPTRLYIPPDRLRGMAFRPTTLRRKVIQVAPQLVILWAGDYNAARKLAIHAKKWFTSTSPTNADVDRFLELHYRDPIENFHAIIAPAEGNWCYRLGNIQKGESLSWGSYLVGGSGAEIFREIVDQTLRREGTADLVALKLANDLLVREIGTGQTIDAGFGAGYEVLCRDVSGFVRLDDVMHFFTQVRVNNGVDLKVSHYPHVLRQWYEGECLYISSLVTMDAQNQGLGTRGYIVPDVLGDELLAQRPPEELFTQPKYMCLFQLFVFDGTRRGSTVILRGGAIDEYFELIREENGVLRYMFKPAYVEMLHEFWNTMKMESSDT